MSLPEVKANYLARAIACSFGRSNNGNVQVAVDCEVCDGEYTGEHIAWIGTFADGKATEIALRALKGAFGWQGDDLSELDNLDADGASRMLPETVELACDMEEYNGEWRLKAKWANKPGGGRFAFKEPLTGPDLKTFAAQMRGTIRGSSGARRPSTPSQRSMPNTGRAPHPNAPGGDDIPF